jgi:hypothetical protein
MSLCGGEGTAVFAAVVIRMGLQKNNCGVSGGSLSAAQEKRHTLFGVPLFFLL